MMLLQKNTTGIIIKNEERKHYDDIWDGTFVEPSFAEIISICPLLVKNKFLFFFEILSDKLSG